MFFGLFTALILLGAALALIPGLPVIELLVGIQVLNGFMLPIILVFILRLINNSKLTGELKNTRLYNLLGWGTFSFVTVAVVLMLGTQFLEWVRDRRGAGCPACAEAPLSAILRVKTTTAAEKSAARLDSLRHDYRNFTANMVNQQTRNEIEFALLRPTTKAASLLGSFTDGAVPMQKGDDGYFRTRIPLVDGVYHYRFRVQSKSWFLPENEWVEITDPYATDIDDASQNGILNIKDGRRIVDEYVWRHDDHVLPPDQSLVIYELHVGDFSGGEDDPFTRGKYTDIDGEARLPRPSLGSMPSD
jgi:hypothetical protein